eukprot:3001506-Prymnesium_polylepis.1
MAHLPNMAHLPKMARATLIWQLERCLERCVPRHPPAIPLHRAVLTRRPRRGRCAAAAARTLRGGPCRCVSNRTQPGWFRPNCSVTDALPLRSQPQASGPSVPLRKHLHHPPTLTSRDRTPPLAGCAGGRGRSREVAGGYASD